MNHGSTNFDYEDRLLACPLSLKKIQAINGHGIGNYIVNHATPQIQKILVYFEHNSLQVEWKFISSS